MKKYVILSSVSNSFTSLDAVIFVGDIEHATIGTVFASERAYVADFSNMSDDELLSLGKDAIRYIEDIPTLVRIGKLDRELLSKAQQDLINAFGGQRLTSSMGDVQALLDAIRGCSDAEFVADRSFLKKNHEFKREFPGIDKVAVLKSLTTADYCETRVGGDASVFCDDLFVFTKTIDIDGDPRIVEVYVKVNRDLSDGTTVALVSFHRANADAALNKPYRYDTGQSGR